MSDLALNQRFGDYELREVLGRTRMATVYLAHKPSTGDLVALKVISESHFGDTDSFKKRFDREIEIARSLKHPNIVRVYDHGHINGRAYLEMQFLAGGNLEKYLKNFRPSPDELGSIFQQIARALIYAHSQGVVHRDLKPSNILLDDNLPFNAYLADFGIAKSVGQNTVTKTGEIIGTPAYIAPELWKGQKATFHVDIYSLGITLFQMLTGKLPFNGETLEAVMFEHLNTMPPDPRAIRPELPDGTHRVIQTALAKRPEDRYSSVDEFLWKANVVLRELFTAAEAFMMSMPTGDTGDTIVSSPTGYALPMLEWRKIPAGEVTIRDERVQVNSFQISKYLVTNQQFQAFVDDPSGYTNAEWWSFSDAARAWRANHPQAAYSHFEGDKRPREMVCWYEAMAFCWWLRYKTHLPIMLPTEAQWQRVAQGDKGLIYPWGNKFDKKLCNTQESGIGHTTDVDKYRDGLDRHIGVYDLCGNVWEWCRTASGGSNRLDGRWERIVRGGSWFSTNDEATTTVRVGLNPANRSRFGGFRTVVTEE